MNRNFRRIVIMAAGAMSVMQYCAGGCFAAEFNPAEVAAVVRTADFAGYLARLSSWLDQKTPAEVDQLTEATLAPLVKEPTFRLALDQRQFIVSHGAAKLSEFAKVPAQQAFLGWLLGDGATLDLYLEAAASTEGKIGDGALDLAILERWHKIYTEDADSHRGVYLKLAMASALWPPGGRCTYRDEAIDWFARYKHFKSAHRNQELVPSFDHLIVHDYGKVISSTASDADLAWGRQMLKTWRPDLLDKEQMNKIVSEVWRRNSPFPFDNGYITVLEGGGKCGPRGAFGAFICQAFGLPAITVGQPAHFCFAARADFPEEEPQRGSAWKVYQGRGWHVSDCGGGMFGPAFLAEMTKRYRTAELSLIAHLQWLAAAQSVTGRATAIRELALRVRQPVNTSEPFGVPAEAIDVTLAGSRAPAASYKTKEAEIEFNKEGASPTTAASNAATTPPRVKEEPIQVPPGVIHLEAETFSGKSPEVTVYDCVAGGKQVNFHKNLESSWLEYTFDVPATGTYSLDIMLATANRDLVLNLSAGGDQLSTLKLPSTIGLWKKIGPEPLQLKQGRMTLRLSAPYQRGIAFRWLQLTPQK